MNAVSLPYREMPPPPALARWVEAFWSRGVGDGEAAGPPRRVLPDGCADVLVAVDRRGARALAVGPMRTALLVPPEPGLWVGVRFRPGRGRSFFGVPLAELADRLVDLADLWPDGEELARDAAAHPSPTAVAALLAAAVERRARAAVTSPLVVAAVARLASEPPQAGRIDALAGALGVTRQHLARRFRDEVGQSPKQLARVFRFRRALATLSAAGARRDLAGLAVDAGFCDQPHLNADFRDLAGASPLALLAEAEGVPDLQDRDP